MRPNVVGMILLPEQKRQRFFGASQKFFFEIRVAWRHRVQVDQNRARSAQGGARDELGSGRHGSRSANCQKQVAFAQRMTATLKRFHRQHFAEQDEIGANWRLAVLTQRQFARVRLGVFKRRRATFQTTRLHQAAVQFHDIQTSRALMQFVHVLRDERDVLSALRRVFLQLRQGEMRSVWLHFDHLFAQRPVKIPQARQALRQVVGVRNPDGFFIVPQAARATKRRHARSRRNARARQNHDMTILLDSQGLNVHVRVLDYGI